MADGMMVFDRRAVRAHRDRAASRFTHHDFLFREVAGRLADRLLDFKRAFPRALDLGCHDGVLARVLRDRGGIETLVQADISPAMVSRAAGIRVVADEEALPFAASSFDLIMTVLSLHWVNDLPGALIQIRRCLRPDGLFLGCMLGSGTLAELRDALLHAEAEVEGGASPRVSPFADVRDAGMLLQRAGFALPVVDTERIAVNYPDTLALMHDLRGMGESNAVSDRRKGFSRRATLARAAARYARDDAASGARMTANFQVLTLTGWNPHESQQKPLAPGSARTSFAAALGSVEKPAGEKAQPKR
jgi:NADH dehydrogenase [ubiquinone] 1 alpha subcomplex assembly factor 5